MDNDDLGPIGERDYPPGCVPGPPRRSAAPRAGASRAGASDMSESPSLLMGFPPEFSSWDDRKQIMERRRKYDELRKHFEKLKTNGESIFRPDLAAMKQMNDEGLSFTYEKNGHVPGVLVGDTFDYRSEMFVVGLHRVVQAGIYYVDYGSEKVAASIVASGGYEDDEDQGDILHYSGQGGNDYKGEKRQVADQTRSVGNEAMVNSYRLKKPVRVIRGHDVETTKGWNKIYSYDGLYDVISAKTEVGASGHKVYKFILKRCPNQPELKARTVRFHGPQPS